MAYTSESAVIKCQKPKSKHSAPHILFLGNISSGLLNGILIIITTNGTRIGVNVKT